jgi:HK97 family phage major capsid protein
VKGRLAELNQEFDGLPFPDEARNEFAGLKKQNEEIDRRVKELEARKQGRRGSRRARGRESSSSTIGRSANTTQKQRDVYDLSTRVLPAARPGAGEHAVPRQRAAGDRDRVVPARRRQDRRGRSQPRRAAADDDAAVAAGRGRAAPARDRLAVYRRAFWKAAMSRQHERPVGEEQRALSLGATTGGQAVPFTLDPTVIPTSNSVVNPARAIGRNVTISGSNTWNGVSSGAITAARAAEAAVTTDNSPTMAAPTATVTKAQAFVPFSIEVQEDWGALEAEMGKLFQDAKDDEEATAFVTGAGTTVNPQGFVTGTTATSAAATGLTVTAANVYALEAALPPRFRPNLSFVANRGIYNIVRGIDTAGGAALWLYISQGLVTQTPTPGNTGATLLGRGAWEASQMQATVVNATKIMIVGDFNYFLVLDRIGMNIELIPFLFGAGQGNLPTGQRGLYAWWRNTSKVLSASAFVAMTGTT